MAELARDVNERLGQKIVGPDGRLKMFLYGDVLGKENVQLDIGFVRSRKSEWAGLDQPGNRERHIERLGLTAMAQRSTPDQLTDALLNRLDKEKNATGGNLTEVVATMLFHRGLPERYITVRAAAYDDLKNGLDTIIVDAETGDVVCTFDEVLGQAGDQRVQEKRQAQEAAIEKGGVMLKYGFTIENGQMVKKSFDHVPVFRLQMNSADMNAALVEMDAPDSELGPVGQELLSQLLDSLGQQTDEYLANPKLKPPMRERLEQYRDTSLAEMRESVSQSQRAA